MRQERRSAHSVDRPYILRWADEFLCIGRLLLELLAFGALLAAAEAQEVVPAEQIAHINKLFDSRGMQDSLECQLRPGVLSSPSIWGTRPVSSYPLIWRN